MVSNSIRDGVSSILGVVNPLNTGRYIELLSLIGKSKRQLLLGFLRDRPRRRVQGWQNRLLSQAGKEILIKAVGQAIPAYCMGTFMLPKMLGNAKNPEYVLVGPKLRWYTEN